jgi:hypothetical protein
VADIHKPTTANNEKMNMGLMSVALASDKEK